MRDIVHVYPLSLDEYDLEHSDADGYRRCFEPDADCALCKQGICVQLEDVYCAEDPGCDRLIVHGLPTAKA